MDLCVRLSLHLLSESHVSGISFFQLVVIIIISTQYTNTDSIVIVSHLLADDACGVATLCEFAAAAAVAISLLLRAKRDLCVGRNGGL